MYAIIPYIKSIRLDNYRRCLMSLKITNLKTGLSKVVAADHYSNEDVAKTFKVYEEAGYYVKFQR